MAAAMLRRSCLACCLLLPFAMAAHGTEYYKWVDQEGNVHFGQKPPEEAAGADVEKAALKFAPGDEAAVKAQQQQQKQLDEGAEQRNEAKEKEQEEQEKLAAKEAECAKIRRQLDILGTGRRLRTEDSGSIVDENERQRRLQVLGKRHSDHCN